MTASTLPSARPRTYAVPVTRLSTMLSAAPTSLTPIAWIASAPLYRSPLVRSITKMPVKASAYSRFQRPASVSGCGSAAVVRDRAPRRARARVERLRLQVGEGAERCASVRRRGRTRPR